ncbi:copper-translocating P-type ATPase [Effusibacillus lacus]|uniref:Copper-translocating P-type ATPase n=1 Tax=Effusibacillus lacus TaxID=1348429 RepID=A0A292YRV8_9BACL|nr:copper-translocating P-type ATPase [Effusibacillus lacus]
MKQAITKVAGVQSVNVGELQKDGSATVEVSYNPDQTKIEQIHEAVKKLGYGIQ